MNIDYARTYHMERLAHAETRRLQRHAVLAGREDKKGRTGSSVLTAMGEYVINLAQRELRGLARIDSEPQLAAGTGLENSRTA